MTFPNLSILWLNILILWLNKMYNLYRTQNKKDQVTIDQQLDFNTLATMLQYLLVSLNGAILDKLRASSRPQEVLLPQSPFPGEPLLEDVTPAMRSGNASRELLNVREQRLAYLLFHCGFKPGEIVRCCSQEFSDVCEIYSLRRDIMERLLRNGNHL
jgi:hypothetical protein